MAKTLDPASPSAAATAWLSAAQTRLLETICETLIPPIAANAEDDPHGLLRRPASVMQVAQLMVQTLGGEDAETRGEFRQLLGILNSPAGGLLLTGRPTGFMRMSPAMRERALYAMANSTVAKLRQGFQAIKRLATFIFYSAPAPDGTDNPNWAAIDFPPPPPPPSLPKPIHPEVITGDTTLDADVIVIGSGAGGGVVAAELAQAGKAVIVLEKGGYFNEADFTGREAGMMPKVYLKQGLLSTKDLSMTILAGSCLGGGTVVNWSTSLRIPDGIAGEWERQFGLSGMTNGDLQRHYDVVAARVGVNVEDSAPNANNTVIERGCERLGYQWGAIPRNASHCEQRCGACGYGCAFSRKQSTLLTYVQDAADHGARFVVNCSVDRVLITQGQAEGVAATVTDPATGATHRLTVRATTVVLAAGAIHSPAVLVRSGLTNPHIGRNLRLHPVAAVTGFYPDPILPWHGSLQTRYSTHFGQGVEGYGFTLEVAPGHPGLLALALPWQTGRQHKEEMGRIAHAAPMIVLVRDKNSGRVTLNKHGEPVVEYPLGEHERAQLTQGTIEALKVHLAAGATRVGTLHSRLAMLDAPAGDEPWQSPAFAAFAREVDARGLDPNRVLLFSAHQMGTCRIAADPRRGVAGDDHQVFGVKGLYVADASTFPTASGVNPMLTILALAHRAAQAIT